MPRRASRITLDVTDVRVERVQEITDRDAIAEGIEALDPNVPAHFQVRPASAFKLLWDSINHKRGFGWDTNPWVWVVEFERAEAQS